MNQENNQSEQKESKQEKKENLKTFSFPNHPGITIEAKDASQAALKLKLLLAKDKTKKDKKEEKKEINKSEGEKPQNNL